MLLFKVSWLCTAALGIALLPFVLSCGQYPTPPGQADAGYGSTEHYISTTYTLGSVGNDLDGTQAWYFVPDELKNGSTAPVVIFLHGHTAIDFALYRGHIEHLLKQGYIVIYPEFQRSDPDATWEDLDQNVMLARAVTAAAAAIDTVGEAAERDRVVVYGHSLGGLFAFCWQGAGGITPERIVMANANMDPSTGIPGFVLPLITLIDYGADIYGPAVTVPALLLWGEADTDLAPRVQQEEAYGLMSAAPAKALYAVRSDDHGYPPLSADHGAAVQSADRQTGLPVEDAIDFRYYYAALDAALDGRIAIDFDMGAWSDGTPVKAVQQLLP